MRNSVRLSMLILALAAALATPGGAAAQQRAPNERPLPGFEGMTLDGESLRISSYIGRRLLLVFFDADVPEARSALTAVGAVAPLGTAQNFAVVGVAVGSTRTAARTFAQSQKVSFPVVDDSNGGITRRLGLQSPVALLLTDDAGYVSWATTMFDAKKADDALRVEDELRVALRLPERSPTELAFGELPRAPLFEGMRLDGGAPFRLADHAGQPVVLIFFLHTCPHCHSALEFLVPQIERVPKAKRPLLVAVSILDAPVAVREMLKQRKLEIPVVLLDPDRKLQNAYGLRRGVPDILFLDGDRRIVHRVQGWRDNRDPALSRMVIAKISGEKIPFLLNPKGYTGSDVCGVCHALELESWHYTAHADAFDTLVTHDASRNPECVGCHVVGFGEPGGYTIAEAPVHLEDVTCENCHGRGGPHLSRGFLSSGDYEPVCLGCHTPTHSLGFDYKSFRRNVSHLQIAAMTAEQRSELGGTRPASLMPQDVDYVGSDACRECHAAEFTTWQQSPHARSLASLEAKGKSADQSCLACHTTAFDLPGGFAATDRASAHPDLARVGCESCHGPGEAHVAPKAERIGTIISLGDKCDSCVILQICGGCHDDANDPGFAFEVEAKIEKQRHGTVEAGTRRKVAAPAASGTASP